MGDLALTPQEARGLPKPNNMIPVITHLDSDFFKDWCVFIKPFINLTPREMDVVACLLKNRWEFSKSKNITDPAILDKMTMDEDAMEKVRESCNMTKQHFYVVMNSLRKKKAVSKRNVLNPRLIPNMRDDGSGCFQLLILFKEKK